MDLVLVTWSYTPPEFFEAPLTVTRDDYEMSIDAGKVEARIAPDVYAANAKMQAELHSSLESRFLGAQLIAHRPFTLSKPAMKRIYPDGHTDVTIELDSLVMTMIAGSVDIKVTRQDGTVVSDSRQERIEAKQSAAERIAKHRDTDALLKELLASFNNAVVDPNNELVHLYEIRDALSLKFGGQSMATTTLGISAADWSRLGRLCNDEPLRQGRHRGKAGAALRDATEDELREARRVARLLIESYLHLIEGATATTPK